MPQSDYWSFGTEKPNENIEGKDEAALLQKQLGDMEGQVKEIRMELAAIKRVREGNVPCNNRYLGDSSLEVGDHPVPGVVPHEEKVLKRPEIAKLREELIRAKNAADEERFQREKYEAKLKDLEVKLNTICTGQATEAKETRKVSNEEVATLKLQIRDLKDELEESRLIASEKTEQMQEYRMKYLQAQQEVEELKRQLDIIDFDNKQVSDQIQIEIQKMKMQFQEKLQELAPLPDLLKATQMQLQEAKQLQRLAEENSQQLLSEIHLVKEKLVVAVNSLNQEKAEKTQLAEDYNALKAMVEGKTLEIEDLNKKFDEYRCKAMRLEEKLQHEEVLYQEKAEECAQVMKELDELKDESNRSLNRNKERSESMRRYLHVQITELERQLIQSRAQCRACQKERDDIRQRMQMQLNNLQENFEVVEIRLRTLQGQVMSLKNSYTLILADEEEMNKIITA